MWTRRLPEHLELLVSDEPVLDVYAFGPWRVADGLHERIAERAAALDRDPRAAEVTGEVPSFFRAETTSTGAELWFLLEFLLGASALRGGPRVDVQSETLGSFLAEPVPDGPRHGGDVGPGRCPAPARRVAGGLRARSTPAGPGWTRRYTSAARPRGCRATRSPT